MACCWAKDWSRSSVLTRSGSAVSRSILEMMASCFGDLGLGWFFLWMMLIAAGPCKSSKMMREGASQLGGWAWAWGGARISAIVVGMVW